MSVAVEAVPPSNVLTLFEGRACRNLAPSGSCVPGSRPRRAATVILSSSCRVCWRTISSTKPLRDFLKSHGYRAHGWKLGHNRGLRANVESDMRARFDELFARYEGRKISLVGWSLGGLYARQLAKRVPDKVRCVITLGSPFAGSPASTHAWQAYEWASGNRIDTPSLLTEGLAEAPPVPTTSIFSRTDGICAWETCLNEEGPQTGEHRGAEQPLRAGPPSGSCLRGGRPSRPAGGRVEKIRYNDRLSSAHLPESGRARAASLHATCRVINALWAGDVGFSASAGIELVGDEWFDHPEQDQGWPPLDEEFDNSHHCRGGDVEAMLDCGLGPVGDQEVIGPGHALKREAAKPFGDNEEGDRRNEAAYPAQHLGA